MYLYHYYDKKGKPFQNLSDLSFEEANQVLENIRKTNPDSFCAKRSEDYMTSRLYFESILREEFIKKGGNIQRAVPHYMVIGHCPWLSSWYEDSVFVKIPIEEFCLIGSIGSGFDKILYTIGFCQTAC